LDPFQPEEIAKDFTYPVQEFRAELARRDSKRLHVPSTGVQSRAGI